MRLIQALLATLVALLLGLDPAAAQTYPKFTGLVVDAANVLPAATKADLEAKLAALQKDTKRQLVVATIPDLQGYDVAEYGVGLGRAWGVGLRDVNNGAILFIAPKERRLRVEVGYGLEPFLTDAFSSVVIREQMVPKLKQNDYAGAVTAGTDALIAQLRASPEEQQANLDKAAAAFDATHKRSPSRAGGVPFGLIFWGLVIGFILLSGLRRRGGGRHYSDGLGSAMLWGAALGGLGDGERRDSGGGFGGGFGDGGGGSDGGWGGGGFTGGGGGSFGGGGASGDW